jgi:hypothetical protein
MSDRDTDDHQAELSEGTAAERQEPTDVDDGPEHPGAGARHQAKGDDQRSLVDELQRPGPMQYIKFSVAVFAAVGVGYGLTFWLFTELGDFGSSGGTILVSLGAFFGFLLGPVVAVGTGTYTALDNEGDGGEDTTLTAAAAGVGAAAGYVVLVLVLIVFASLASSGSGGSGGGGTDLPGGVGGTFGLLVGIATTAALSVYLTVRVRAAA